MKPYPGKKKLLALFLLAFTLKFLTAIFLRYLLSCTPIGYHLDELVIRGHDYFSYHAAMENYIQTGTYYFFNGKENVYAGRLPHFSLEYLFFRQFLSVALANFMVLVVQLTLECVSIIILALFAAQLSQSRFSFYLTYVLCLASLSVTFYSIIVLPDSLSVSFLIIFSFLFYIYLKKHSNWLLILAGIFLALLVVLKPYFSLLYLFVGFSFMRETRKKLWQQYLRRVAAKTLIFSVPLLVMLLPWVIRNYQVYHRFIPFQVDIVAGYDYTRSDFACRRYLQTFGEDLLYWDKASAGYYFKTCQDTCTYKFPAYVFTTHNNLDRIEAVREQYQELQQNFKEELDQEVAAAFLDLTLNFAREKPFRYYVLSRLASLQNFLIQGGPSFLPFNKDAICYQPYYLFIYYLQVALYWGSLVIGLIGLWVLGKKDRHSIILIAVPVYLLLFFPLIMQLTEGRYFLHSYPFLLLGLVYIIGQIRRRFVSGKM
ncbi:MAG: hypothetical protein ACO1OF_04945 [Adhaeribacter sp.]